mmetsp:Transcript_58412/g.162830  ORF Transcript_58412/g.162830 Transcript_58412/m.162830 type:complete len:215 (+) Transcript_58412:1724-2368(+)
MLHGALVEGRQYPSIPVEHHVQRRVRRGDGHSNLDLLASVLIHDRILLEFLGPFVGGTSFLCVRFVVLLRPADHAAGILGLWLLFVLFRPLAIVWILSFVCMVSSPALLLPRLIGLLVALSSAFLLVFFRHLVVLLQPRPAIVAFGRVPVVLPILDCLASPVVVLLGLLRFFLNVSLRLFGLGSSLVLVGAVEHIGQLFDLLGRLRLVLGSHPA